MNQRASRLDNILEVSGGFMWSEEVSGELRQHGVTVATPATVRAGQLHDGTLIAEVLTEGIWNYEEHSDVTIEVESDTGQFLELEFCFVYDAVNDYSEPPVQSTTLMFPGTMTFRPRSVKGNEGPSRITFGLINLEASSDIEFRLDGTDIDIQKVRDYETQLHLLAHLRRPRVTYQATASSVSDPLGIWGTFDDLDTTCRLLSLFRGTRVEWVYAQEYEKSGVAGTLRLRSPFARGFGQLSPIPTSPYALLEMFKRPTEPLGYAVAITIQNYRLKRAELRLSDLIDAILDAMSEVDFIELRGAKACVALEMVVHAYERSGLAPYSPNQLTEDQQEKVREAIKPVIREAVAEIGLPKQSSARINRNTRGLFRIPLGERLQLLSDHLNAGLSRDDISRVVMIRNSLVHTGGFLAPGALSNIPDERSESMLTQYLIVLDAVHRLLLKTIGYDGPYSDRSLGLDKTETVTI